MTTHKTHTGRKMSNTLQVQSYGSFCCRRCALTIVGHGQNGDLGDGAASAFHSAGAFIDGGQIGVHVARKPSTPGYFFSGSRDLKVRRSWGKQDKGCKYTFPFALYLNHIWEKC